MAKIIPLYVLVQHIEGKFFARLWSKNPMPMGFEAVGEAKVADDLSVLVFNQQGFLDERLSVLRDVGS